MDSVEQFKKKINSFLSRANDGRVVLLPFLDEREGHILETTSKGMNLSFISDGGIINAERKRYLYTTYLDKIDFKIVVYSIIYNKKFYEINHRAILGSLMGLGIKRECIGDITIIDKDAYFAATEEISSFLESEFNYVGNIPIKLERIDYPIYNEVKYDITLHFLASLRLDAVVSQACHISRSEANEMIVLGLVMVNHEIINNTSFIVKENDELSIRHKGHYKIHSIGNESKSGRIKVEIAKRV